MSYNLTNYVSIVGVVTLLFWGVLAYYAFKVGRFCLDWIWRNTEKPKFLHFWMLFGVLPVDYPSVDSVEFRMLQGPVDRVLHKRALAVERAVQKRETIEKRYPKPEKYQDKPHFTAVKGARPWLDRWSYRWSEMMADLALTRFYYARKVAEKANVATGDSWTDYLGDVDLRSDSGRQAAKRSDDRIRFQPKSNLGRLGQPG